MQRSSPISKCASRADPQLASSSLSLNRVEVPQPEHYRNLFRLIGAPWLWFSRLIIDDAHLAEIIQHPKVELYSIADESGREVGLLELDFRAPGECELAFVGLVPELSGQGHGRWLLSQAVHRAWREGVSRVHVHTCSLDHPAALGAYRRAGFVPYKRAVERFPDPRLLGILPLDCRASGPAAGDADLRLAARQLNVDPRQHHRGEHREHRLRHAHERRKDQRRHAERLDLAHRPGDRSADELRGQQQHHRRDQQQQLELRTAASNARASGSSCA